MQTRRTNTRSRKPPQKWTIRTIQEIKIRTHSILCVCES